MICPKEPEMATHVEAPSHVDLHAFSVDRGSLLGGPKELLLGQRAASIQIDLQEKPDG